MASATATLCHRVHEHMLRFKFSYSPMLPLLLILASSVIAWDDVCKLPPLAAGISTLKVNDLLPLTVSATDEDLLEFYPKVLTYSEKVLCRLLRILSRRFSLDY
jgi:hypothetical protein